MCFGCKKTDLAVLEVSDVGHRCVRCHACGSEEGPQTQMVGLECEKRTNIHLRLKIYGQMRTECLRPDTE